jgi:hypothetical protein
MILAPGIGTFDMAIGEFNGDGKLDVALADYNSATKGDIVQIMLGNGDGTFSMGQTVNLPMTPRSITTGDFDNYGKLDLAVALDKVYFYKGTGNGTFSSAGSIPIGQGATVPVVDEVRVGDFNGDGKTPFSRSTFITAHREKLVRLPQTR